jgi:hypothetical protein
LNSGPSGSLPSSLLEAPLFLQTTLDMIMSPWH